MKKTLSYFLLCSCICFALTSSALARNGASVSITSGPLFIDDVNGLDYKVGHTSTYTFMVQMESDTQINAATLGFVLYSPDGSLSNVIWNSIPTTVGPWDATTTWTFTGGALMAIGPDVFDGSLPSTWMTGGFSIRGTGGYGPIESTDGLTFTITFPGIDGGVLCVDSAFFPPSGDWLALPAPVFEWAGGRGDGSVGGSRADAFCVTAFRTSEVVNCPGFALVDHCDTLHYQTFFETDSAGQLTYSVTTTGIGDVSIDSAGNVTYVPGEGESVAILITTSATAADGSKTECNTAVTLTNNSPVITCLPDIIMIEGNTNVSPPAGVSDEDICDSHVFSLVSVVPTPQGEVTVDSITGAVTFKADSADASGGLETKYTVCISVSDGLAADKCCLTYTILPYIAPCPDSVTLSHCDVLNYPAFEFDLDPTNNPTVNSITTTGAGAVTIDANGLVTYIPAIKEIGAVSITVSATSSDGVEIECITAITITNNAPTVTCPRDIAVLKGTSETSTLANGTDADACDALTYSLVSVTPRPLGSVSVDSITGAVTFEAELMDAVGGMDTDYEICLKVTDGIEVEQCCMVFTVLNTEAFCISIEQTDATDDPPGGSIQGHQVDICINYEAGSNDVGGFDFLIEYDNQALTFVGATEGNIFPDYEWEYFTYRFGPTGSCTGGCPAGKLRIVGLAEQNDGMHHPNNTQLVAGDQFACMTFLVSNDRNLGCQVIPIRWSWADCGDNALSSFNDNVFYNSRYVFDYRGTDMSNVLDGFRANITLENDSFPTVRGAPIICDGPDIQRRFIDFKNGGVLVTCFDESGPQGDVNLNGLGNEIADAVMFSEYFVSGLAAFGTHVEGSIAATQINCNGVPLEVADLVYLIRIISGRSLPCNSFIGASDTAVIAVNDEVISSSKALGAALFVFERNSNVTLLANNMQMKTGVVDGNLRVLVYGISNPDEFIHPGPVLSASGELLSVEVSDTNGVKLEVQFDFVTGIEPNENSALPLTFALGQNYPNPFNPTTTITADFPRRSEYTLSFYNIRGQKVDEYRAVQSPGTLKFVWDPQGLPTGIYFYKLRAGDFVATKKLLLLK